MFAPFRLRATLGRTYNADLEDTRRAKQVLARLGHYETPGYGIDEYPDEPLFQGIESFQERHGLRRDGIMKPDGETAAKLGEVLGAAERQEARPTPAAFGLTDAVGPGRANNPHDVNATGQALAWAGFPVMPGDGSGTAEATKRFQQSQNLKVDGWLRPHGETEEALNRVLRPKVEALKASDTSDPRLYRQGQSQGTIRVPVPKGLLDIATYFGLPVLMASEWLKSMNKDERDQVKSKVAGHRVEGDDDDLEKECEIRYAIDTETCNGITRNRGRTAGWRCHKTAADRYDACLRGVPVQYLPPLDTWNQ